MNFKDIYDIKIPVNGTKRAVERIRDLNGNILWEVPKVNVNFRDNVDVYITYDIADNSVLTYLPTLINLKTNLVVLKNIVPLKYIYFNKCGALATSNDKLEKFSTINFAYNSNSFTLDNNNDFEIVIKFTTGANVNSPQTIFCMVNDYTNNNNYDNTTKYCYIECRLLLGKIYIFNTNAIDVIDTLLDNIIITANTTYWIKISKSITSTYSLIATISTDGVYYSNNKNINFSNSYVEYLFGRKYTLYLGSRIIKYINQNDVSNYSIFSLNGSLPFLGSIDLTLCYIIYNSTKWLFNIIDNDYLTLINDNNLTTSNLILLGFTNKKYAHTPIYINWNTTNNTSVFLKIHTSTDVFANQLLFSMQKHAHCELCIYNNKIYWEYGRCYSDQYILGDRDYFVLFEKKYDKVEIKVYDESYNLYIHMHDTTLMIAPTNITNQYMYFGIDKEYGGEPFKGTIDLKLSYLIYNDKTYRLRIDNGY